MKTKFTSVIALVTCALGGCAAPPPPTPAERPFGAEPVPAIELPPPVPAFPPAPGAPAVEPTLRLLAQAAAAPKPMKGEFRLSRGRGGRTLIIQSSDPDPKTYGNLEEDLNVMYRILSKTRKQDENGFKLESIFQGSSGGVKSMYIEGYGAVFMLGVRFPLVAPQTPEEQPKPKDTTSEEWEGARKELYARNTLELDFDHIWGKAISSQAEEYDAQKGQNAGLPPPAGFCWQNGHFPGPGPGPAVSAVAAEVRACCPKPLPGRDAAPPASASMVGVPIAPLVAADVRRLTFRSEHSRA